MIAMAKGPKPVTGQLVVCEGLFTPTTVTSQLSGIPSLQNGPFSAIIQFADVSDLVQAMTLKFSPPGGDGITLIARSRPVKPPPVGFGTQHYDTENQKYHYIFEPVVGEQLLDPEKASDCPMDYRFQEIIDRLSRGPVEFRWLIETTHQNKPAQAELGRLSIQAICR
jgi:hypothetical protein